MTFDADKLRALDEAATPELKTVSPRTMAGLLRVGAKHQRPRAKDWERAKFDADGLLISTLLNGLPAILAMAEENARMREALADPTAVHANMLRGTIAKPEPRSIWHIYGRDLLEAMPDAFRSLRTGSRQGKEG